MTGRPFGQITTRIAGLKVGQSCFVSRPVMSVGPMIISAKHIAEPGATYTTETREGGVLVTRTG